MTRLVASSVVLAGTIAAHGTAFAQQTPMDLTATPLPVEAAIESVTVYSGRASVSRTARLNLEPGLYDLQFGGLPESIQPDSIHARASGPMKIIGLDYEPKVVATAPSQQVAELDEQIESLQVALQEVADLREALKTQEEFIKALSIRATTDASEQGGTKELDLNVVRQQLAFIGELGAKLFAERRTLNARQKELNSELRVLQARRSAIAGRSTIDRTAVVTAVVTAPTEATMELVYLVSNAQWQPSYNIRAAAEGGSVIVEYDALLSQRSGENWEDVRMTLSTAQPTLAANPPALTPWYVDVQRPIDRGVMRSRRAATAAEPPATLDKPAGAGGGGGFPVEALEALAADAEVGGVGPSVTFQLPRPVTVTTHAAKQKRTRIATIDTAPEFVHVALPLLTEAVYIRGELTNTSAYQLLPGAASIFVGQDYVGPTYLGSVAPQSTFDVYFGIDQAIKATRQLVSKKTSKTGLFSGGLVTNYDYRLEIDNGAGKPLTLELWDRYPVSRSDQIRIELRNLSRPLAADTEYEQEEKPQGLLKWMLSVPAGATGKSAFATSYGVRVHRAKDVQMTRLPE
ncbi:MAG: mucoidy inhibitor MuiA family protein [Planctomycetota bacterium]|jgi:uncharacterized protein (TIGR02231 family)